MAVTVASTQSPQTVTSRLPRDFHRFWAGLSASLGGARITSLAIPLIAAVEVGVSPLQMGALAAASEGAYLLVSLPVGLKVDRIRRRPVMISADICCALLLLSISVAYAVAEISFAHLCVVVAGVGLLSATGEIARMAYLPTLVGREHLIPANSRIQMSHSVADSAGPGVGGVLVQFLSAPIAIVTSAAGYLFSAATLARIGKREPVPARQDIGTPREALAEGFTALLGHPLLRPIVLTSVGSGLFGGGVLAMFILYASRELGLSALMIGGVFALGGLAAVPGSMAAGWAGRRFGIGPAIVWGWIIEAAAWLVLPLAGGPLVLVLGLLGFSRAVEGFSGAVANIHQWTLRQVIIPDHLHGRVTASHRFMVYGAGAIGALLGGALGSVLDLRVAMMVCALGALAARSTAAFSALRVYRG